MLQLTSSKEAAALAEKALKLLEGEIGTLPGTSPLIEDFVFITEHHDSYIKQKTWAEGYDFSELSTRLRREVGALEMAKRIVGLSNIGELSHFKEPLKLLSAGGVSQAAHFKDYDQQWGKPLDHTRKLFEFAVAAGVRLNGGKQVEVASEKDNSQKNPDVLIQAFSIEAVACKVVSGENLQTLIENIEKGSSQIQKSGRSKGVVALDVRHRVDTQLLFPRIAEDKYRTFKNVNEAEEAVQRVLGEIADELLANTDAGWKQSRFDETHCKAFTLTAQSCAIIETAHGPVPTLVGKGRVIPLVSYSDAELRDECELNRWIGDSVPKPQNFKHASE